MARSCAAITMATAIGAAVITVLHMVSYEASGGAASRRLAAGIPNVQVPNVSSAAYPDSNAAGCTIGKSCTVGTMPSSRGICVKSGLTEECWDVCNPAHAPNDYSGCPKGQPIDAVSCPGQLNSALSGMVSAVRQGQNSWVKCPQSLVVGDLCPPGKVCSQEVSESFDIPYGQGMCAVQVTGGHVCLDICDAKNALSDFTKGTADGTGDKVSAMKGSMCGSSIWSTIGLVLLCIVVVLCCVGAGFKGYQTLMARKKRSIGKSLEAQPEFNQKELNENFVDAPPGEQGPGDYGYQQQQDFSNQQFDYGQVDQGYNPGYGQDPGQGYMQDRQMHDTLPPEPPRMEPVQMQQYQEPLPPQLDRRSHDSFNNRFSPSQSHNQQFDFGGPPPGSGAFSQGPGTPGPGSMRIAGLSEPQLFQSIQPLSVPGTGVQPQMTPPDLLSQALPTMQQPNMFVNAADPLGTSQPGGFAPAFRPAGSFQGNFQVPTTFTTQPPMSGISAPSMQLNQGAQPFFTQLRR